MSVEKNKAICRRVPLELFNQGNLAVADEVFAPDYIEHVELPGLGGLAGLKQFTQGIRVAFPDFMYEVEDEVAEGEKVVLRLKAHGTQQGPFLGFPASGKKASWSEVHIARIVEGKLIEHWVEFNQLDLFQQLGIIPAAPSPTQELSDENPASISGEPASDANGRRNVGDSFGYEFPGKVSPPHAGI